MNSSIDVESFEDDWDDDEVGRRRPARYSVRAKERIQSHHDSARVVSVDRGQVEILVDDVRVPAVFGGSVRGEKVVVGDDVRIRPPRHETDVARILEIHPRRTVLTRTADDEQGEERVVAANIDQVVVVLAADRLDVGVRFLDRVLVAASVGGAVGALCVNRVDLVDDRSEVERVQAGYDAIHVRSVATSAVTGEGLEDLEALLAGSWSVLSGHSGVGKSSLVNRLVPEAERQVGELGRFGGRHTTVAARAMQVPHLDAWLVDTPGVRSFGLGGISPRDLAGHFPELVDLGCDLDDCLHDGEPGCRLGEADISPERLDSYRRLLAGLRPDG